MKRPCPRRGIVALAQSIVKSWSDHAPILARPNTQTLTWREVADFRERLAEIPPENANEVLRILHRGLDEIRMKGGR